MSTTSLPPAAHPVRALLDQLGGLLDQLTVAEVWTLGEADLLAARVAVETQTARLTAVRWALTREIKVRGAAVAVGATSTGVSDLLCKGCGPIVGSLTSRRGPRHDH